MHLALARKYRPQSFLDLKGQGPIIKTLQNAIESERLHHAYLFSGVRGIGKTSMARIFAKSINCEKGPSISPCQVCHQCVEITKSSSLDVIEIDGASHNLVEDVRELREQVKFLPSSGKYKIIIIDEVHMLSNSAFNALLKTLEEPPAHVLFIFATTEPHKIPMTILSRCQKYDFRKLTVSVLHDHLKDIAVKENVNITDDALHLITNCAQGSVRDGVSLLDQVVSYKDGEITASDVSEVLGLGDRVLTQQMFAAIVKENLEKSLECLNQVDERGVDLKLFSEGLLQSFRHLILLESTGKMPVELSQSEQDEFAGLKGVLDVSLLLAQYQVLFKGIQELSYSDFSKTSFEITLVKLSRVRDMIGLTDLVQNILGRQKNTKVSPKSPPQQFTTQQSTANRPQSPVANDWYALVKWMTSKKPPLGSLLKDVVPVTFESNNIEVVVSPTSQVRDILIERTEQIGALITEHFGHAVNFKISDQSDEKKKPLV